jgi:hypothetical protein
VIPGTTRNSDGLETYTCSLKHLESRIKWLQEALERRYEMKSGQEVLERGFEMASAYTWLDISLNQPGSGKDVEYRGLFCFDLAFTRCKLTSPVFA